MNIVLLMAGPNHAFKNAGHPYPKNLVEIAGKPLVQRVIDHLSPLIAGKNQVICLLKNEEQLHFHTGSVIQLVEPSAEVVFVKGETAGAACTALLAVSYINNNEPLLIMNGDQLIASDLPTIIEDFVTRQLDGGIVVFDDVHPRWSFVKTDSSGLVVETAEKRPISRFATAGFYYFARGNEFVNAAMAMIKKDSHVEGNFFICPVFNEMILNQAKIGVYEIPRRAYRSLAMPGDVEAFEAELERSRQN